MRYEERGQGYCDVEKVGKHWFKVLAGDLGGKSGQSLRCSSSAGGNLSDGHKEK
jgi:hypothetical protein